MALCPRNLLDRMFGDGVVIGSVERLGIFDVQLFLASLCLAFCALDRDASGIEVVADRPHDVFFFGGLEDVIILIICADWR